MTHREMVIVAGHILVDPARRDAYLARSIEVVQQARATEGCLDFSMGADLVEAGRINIYERWASAEAVQAFRGSGPEGDQATDIIEGSVAEFDVTNEQQLG